MEKLRELANVVGSKLALTVQYGRHNRFSFEKLPTLASKLTKLYPQPRTRM